MSAAETNIRLVLALAVGLSASRVVGWLGTRIGQPRVIGEIVTGILLGPSLLGMAWPEALAYLFPPTVILALKSLAHVGLVVFMVQVGIELDTNHLQGQARRIGTIGAASTVVPIGLGCLLGLWLHPRFTTGTGLTPFVLFLGAAMGVTAIPVLARILQESGLVNTQVGTITLTCAAVSDLVAWTLLAVVIATVNSDGPLDVLRTVGLGVAFTVAMLTIGRRALAAIPHPSIAATVAIAFASAWIAERIGIHSVFGGFIAGVAFPRHGPDREHLATQLGSITSAFLLPTFFIVAGLSTRIGLVDSAYLWAVCALVIAVAIVGKAGGSAAAARLVEPQGGH